jgi:hypothetical protein
VVSFTPRPLCPRERAPDTHWIGGWVGPRAGQDTAVTIIIIIIIIIIIKVKFYLCLTKYHAMKT